MAKRVVIIGAGYAGLSLGCLLRQAGYPVTILEKNSTVGGRARLWTDKGYSFDMGPSWYLMPEVFDHFFELFRKKTSDYYALDKLATYYKVFFEGEAAVKVTSDPEQNRRLFASFEADGDKKLDSYLEKARYKYEIAMKEFLYKEYSSLFSFFNWRVMTEGLKLDLFASLEQFTKKFFHDHRARKILEYAMVFLGTSPKDAPALYSIMSHVDLTAGVWFPRGGMNAVAEGLARLFVELGGEIRTGQEVQEVVVEGGRATGVRSASGLVSADLVINCADYHHGETKLLPERYQTYKQKFWQRQTLAPSMFIVYIGVKKPLDLEHHNLYFSRHWNEHFDKIFKRPAWPSNPCFYLSAITKTDPAMAPAGRENLFLLVPVAPGLTQTDAERQARLKEYLDHVEQVIGQKFQDDIEVLRVYDQQDFIRDYNAYQGTALGLAHTLFQTAAFRPAHRSKKVKNLFYSGQYTHPGVGVPMTLISSEVVFAEIMKQEGQQG